MEAENKIKSEAIPLIVLDGVEFGYGDREFERPVLREINLDLIQGEALSVVGPSGEGKSTLLKIMVGLIEPQAGQVSFESKNLRDCTKTEIKKIRRRIGMTFQNSGLFDSWTCEENLKLPLVEVLRENSKSVQEKKISAMLDRVGLRGVETLYPHELSGGMKKRLGIARALITEPEVVFFDEPTAGLDPVTAHAIADLIQEYHADHKTTVVTVTSDLGIAGYGSDRIALLFDGVIAWTGSYSLMKRSENPLVQQFVKGNPVGPLTEHL